MPLRFVLSVFLVFAFMEPAFSGSNSHKVKNSTKFNSESPYALVVFSVRISDQSYKTYTSNHWLSLVWRHYNPKTKSLIDGGKDTRYGFPVLFHEKNKNEDKIVHGTYLVHPGVYVLESNRVVYNFANNIESKYTYYPETTSFIAEAGKIYFLGDFEFTFPRVLSYLEEGNIPIVSDFEISYEILGYNVAKAQEFIATFKKISGEIVQPEFTPASLICKEKSEKETRSIYKKSKLESFCQTETLK